MFTNLANELGHHPVGWCISPIAIVKSPISRWFMKVCDAYNL
jgi:hypothetical protein